MLKEPCLPDYLPIAEGRGENSLTHAFLKEISIIEKQTSSSRVWTRVSLFTLYDGYHFTSNTEWSYLPTPPLGQDMTQDQFFKRSLTGLNSEFSFS